jgi:hypothetical protein
MQRLKLWQTIRDGVWKLHRRWLRKTMATFDVVLHANGGIFRENAQQLSAAFPPVKERVDLGFGCWVGRLDGDLANVLMDTCDPTFLGVMKPVRQFAQLYTYVRELDDNEELYRWDWDLRLQRCIGMSRLIHRTTVGFRYAARVRQGSSSDPLKIVPAGIHGLSLDVFLSPNHERDWLTAGEAQQLANLLAVSETLQQPAFPPRVSRALWYFDYAQRTYYADLRWTLIATALEALVHTGKTGSTKHFKYRVPALAQSVGGSPLTTDEANLAWDFRSRLSHGDGFLFSMPNADIALYDKLENTLRLAILKAFLDPTFANIFADDKEIAKHWPV